VLTGTLAAQSAVAAEQIRFETDNEGELITITASADMQVAPGTVWAVISDYDRLAEFIPDMRSSRVIRRDGASWRMRSAATCSPWKDATPSKASRAARCA
jgi:hypothetical protein